MYQKIAILGIHTDIGKSVVASIMTEALQADYWKPIQAGDLDNSDSIKTAHRISNKKSTIHPEALKLLMAASPHTAAADENIAIDYKNFAIPKTKNTLLIETAGGIFSPINDNATMLDFVVYYNWPVVLVMRNYLGSINHTVLCLEALKQRDIKVIALVISGERDESAESFILNYTDTQNVIYVNELNSIDKEQIKKESIHFKNQWQNLELDK